MNTLSVVWLLLGFVAFCQCLWPGVDPRPCLWNKKCCTVVGSRAQYFVPAKCSNFHLQWNMSNRGSITLEKHNPDTSKEFNLCLKSFFASNRDIHITDVTDGKQKHLRLPKTGHPACAKSVNGKASLKLDATFIVYVDYFDFYVAPA